VHIALGGIVKQHIRPRFCGLAIAPALMAFVDVSFAADPNSARSQPDQRAPALEEIIVTAQRREERAQDVPLAITAFDAAALARIGFTNLGDLMEKVPSLAITPYPNSSSSLVIFMRGVGQIDAVQIARDPGVGIYADDVYLARGMALTVDLGDTERVEVLRGPQGTLYGRNTIGGAVKFISAKPTGKFGIKETLDVGNLGYIRSLTNVNLPAVGGLSSKLTYLNSSSDGWVDNPGASRDFGEKEQEGYRVALRWQPLGALMFDYVYDHATQDGAAYYEQRQYSFPLFPFAFPLLPDRVGTSSRPVDLPIRDDFTGSGHSLTATWDLAESATLKSISAYRELDANQLHDTVEAFNLPAVIGNDVQQHQFSQELLLSGAITDPSLKYHVGAFYFTETGDQQGSSLANPFGLALANPYVPPTLADLAPPVVSNATNESVGVYADVSWSPSILDDGLSIDAGGRYSKDTRDALRVGSPPGDTEYSRFDPSVTVDYRWTEDLHAYVRYATAYRAGGFNLLNSNLSPFEPEKLTSYEVGLKSLWWDSRLRLNIDAFTQTYDDMQLDFIDPALQQVFTLNAGKAKFKGVEGEIELLPVEGLRLAVDLTYMDAEQSGAIINPFTQTPVPGTSLPNAPEWKYNASAEYTFPKLSIGTLSVLAGYSFRDDETSNGGPGTAGDPRPSYSLINARVTLSDIPVGIGRVALALWGNNLADKEYQYYHNFGAAIFGQPRSYGVNVVYNYE
jgi:iron complex outermembrane receptor protein